MAGVLRGAWTYLRQNNRWADLANWTFVAAGVADAQNSPEKTSTSISTALCFYSAVAGRLAWRQKKFALVACHVTNEVVQLHNLRRYILYQNGWLEDAEDGVPTANKTRVVVLGSGFGSMSFVTRLERSLTGRSGWYDLSVISPRNYFLYTPLLPGAATGAVEGRSIVDSVRNQLAGKGKFLEAEAIDVDPVKKEVTCRYHKAFRGGDTKERIFTVPYDILVYAVGSINNTFNVPGVEQNCFFLKDMEHAKALRQRINECFEIASLPSTTPDERKRLLSFVVVGGGPTGVELAAEVHDAVLEDMNRLFPGMAGDVSVKLVDTHDHILSAYDRQLAEYATEQFRRSGIELVLNCRVHSVDPGAVIVARRGSESEERVEYGTCVWATGIKMNPLTEKLIAKLPDAEQQHWKSIRTDSYLQVKGTDGSIFALGDASTIEQDKALEHAAELFKRGDLDNDGVLTCRELQDLMKQAKHQYPQLAEYGERLKCESDEGLEAVAGFVRRMMRTPLIEDAAVKDAVVQEAKHKGIVLTLEQFQEQLADIEQGLRALPATAQVASQQGKYLAQLFTSNHVGALDDQGRLRPVPKQLAPFRYKNLGSLAYIGADNAVMDMDGVSWLRGWLMGWAWKGMEAWMQVSVKNMWLVARDMVSTKIFGRDISDL